MSYKIGIAGPTNTGKSFSRSFIPDGENVFLLMPSLKTTNLVTSDGKVLRPFNIKTKNYKNLDEALAGTGAPSVKALVKAWNNDLAAGSFKKDSLTGNIVMITDLTQLPIYLKFVSKHLPWIHTVILPDFTHHISNVISTDEFIERRAGNEAYQKFWELAGAALRNFIISMDSYREDLLVITEYHAVYDENSRGFDLFVPAGKMLNEKFLIPSYYDYLFFTDVRFNNEGEANESAEYRFVTKPTKKYPQARSKNLFTETYIPNNLQLVMDVVRKDLGIELPK